MVTKLAGPVEFTVRYVGPQPLPADDLKELAAFQSDVLRLQRDLNAATSTAGELTSRLEQVKAALDATPAAPAEAREAVRKLIAGHRETLRLPARRRVPPGPLGERADVDRRAGRARPPPRRGRSIDRPTGTQREQLKIARDRTGPRGGQAPADSRRRT